MVWLRGRPANPRPTTRILQVKPQEKVYTNKVTSRFEIGFAVRPKEHQEKARPGFGSFLLHPAKNLRHPSITFRV